jgi:hypothetical protein
LVVPQRGSLEATGDLFVPYRLVDGDGAVVVPVAAFFAELARVGGRRRRSARMGWICCAGSGSCGRSGWLGSGDPGRGAGLLPLAAGARQADAPALALSAGGCARDRARTAAARTNAVTGKPSRGDRYEASTVAHCESVLRGFYDFHSGGRDRADGQPVPAGSAPSGRSAHAHHNPMDPFAGQRSGRYRPKVVGAGAAFIPDERFDALFAQLGSHRDRALVAFWVSTGGAGLGAAGRHAADVDPGQQLITVIRKGTRALQPLPAAPDAFVWLRLYQAQLPSWCPPAGTSRCGGRCGARSER